MYYWCSELDDLQQVKATYVNENKTESIVLGTPQNLKKLPQIYLHIGHACIDPTDSVRNLGIMFDSHKYDNEQASFKASANQAMFNYKT